MQRLDSRIAVIGILLVTLWGAFGGTMGPYEAMNAIKHDILTCEDSGMSEYMLSRLKHDWLTMSIGTTGFLGLISMLIVSIPFGMVDLGRRERWHVNIICWATALLPLFGVYVGLILGPREYALMLSHIAHLGH